MEKKCFKKRCCNFVSKCYGGKCQRKLSNCVWVGKAKCKTFTVKCKLVNFKNSFKRSRCCKLQKTCVDKTCKTKLKCNDSNCCILKTHNKTKKNPRM